MHATVPTDPLDDVRAALSLRAWLGSIGGWTALALAMTASVVHGHAPSADFVELLVAAAPAWAAHALMTPPVLAYDAWLAGRGRGRGLQVVGHLVGVVVFVSLHHVLAMSSIGGGLLPWVWIVYLALVIVARLLRADRMAKRRLLRAERLERELATARVAALQSKLQPHFLFNTLHAIGATMRDDPETARRMLTRLGDLLRAILELDTTEITLGDDLAILRPYVELQRLRHGDRVEFRIDVPAELSSRRVPALLLQPLVENAMRHGIESRAGVGQIHVRARETDGRLVVSVADDGVGKAQEGYVEGNGLGGLRRRLRELYAGAAELTIAPSALSTDGTGFDVSVRLPTPAGA